MMYSAPLVCIILVVLWVNEAESFSPPVVTTKRSWTQLLSASKDDAPSAELVGYVAEDERWRLEQALMDTGFRVLEEPCSTSADYRYSFSKATGMLQLQQSGTPALSKEVPRWIPLVKNMENILVANGWSFLDPDENDPLSAFDIDAANLEGQYQPKWGLSEDSTESVPLSQLGFSLRLISKQDILQADLQSNLARQVLLEGATDPPNIKETHNGFSFAGSVCDIPEGAFVCAIGGLPLFTTKDLSPSTASSGWLSFSQPVADDHIQLVHPASADLPDQRIEVVCAKSRCHLGHYFGKGQGYCINASALNFVPTVNPAEADILKPTSWRLLKEQSSLLHSMLLQTTPTESLLLGAGCFWHVEFALAQLPGVVSTQVGYAGGTHNQPTYETVSKGTTGHAEVVKVIFDPNILQTRILMDCFLAMHDPTKVRAHGKHALGSGQYRSCVFCSNRELLTIAQAALHDCQAQLDRELSTDLRQSSSFWLAEERHQQHKERRRPDLNATMTVQEWLREHGSRSETVVGSSETLNWNVS